MKPVLEGDVSLLCAMSIKTASDTFAKDNTPKNMALFVEEAYSEGQLLNELREESNQFYFAFRDGLVDPVGYLKLCTSSKELCVTGTRPIELARIYVDLSSIGTGVGSHMMQFSLDQAVAGGHDTIWLGVWEHNPRALAFYHHWGFEEVGSHIFQFGEDPQNDLILQKSLVLS